MTDQIIKCSKCGKKIFKIYTTNKVICNNCGNVLKINIKENKDVEIQI
jgi:DNA-directed RNA polymerase subunit RPC12/RpoP